MKIDCYKCGNNWDYNGENKSIVFCTKCSKKLYFSKLVRLENGKKNK